MRTATCKILYADDDRDDHYFLKESFQSSGIDTELVFAGDGQEVINYLENNQQESLPSLIILDLNMPRLGGRETLSILKKHSHYASIPVVILSTSVNNAEKEHCRQEGAASCFVKPRRYTDYQSLVQSLHYFM